jgi:membrane protease YdiL (CAAX protease family)
MEKLTMDRWHQGLFSKLMVDFPIHASVYVAALLTLLPFLYAAFWPPGVQNAQRLPLAVRIVLPGALCVPYAMVAVFSGQFRWGWFALYLLLPVMISFLLYRAGVADPEQRGDWRDLLVLAVLGLAVDLRWFEPAWPHRLAVFNKMLLLDAGIYGFLAIRRLEGVGFDLRLRMADLRIGLREFVLYAPMAIALGLSLSFLHFHAQIPSVAHIVLGWVFTFFFIAVPEELFFRGWMQNLLERRIGRHWALLTTAVLFGLSHFNKRAVHFNWRYVLLAGIAGIFYGRAWRQERRVGASAFSHASVDTLWSLWLR